MVVGYQNLLTLVSLTLVYHPPLLNLGKKKKDPLNVLVQVFLWMFLYLRFYILEGRIAGVIW